MNLFNRDIKILFQTDTQALEVSGLRITFNIVKTETSGKNEVLCKLYNLSKKSRALIESEDLTITISAGYEGYTEVLAVGDVIRVEHKRVGPDYITEIEAGDGLKALNNTTIFDSFAPGTGVKDIISKVTKSFGLAIREIPAQIEEQFANGFSVAGKAKDVLNSLAKSFGFDWSIQDNEIQVILKDSVSKNAVVVLNKHTGMIGTPDKLTSDPKKISGNKGWLVKSLLNPKIKPGTLILIESEVVNGNFKATSVKYTGDTHGNEWQVEAEVKEVQV